ncbi:MAG: retropepsin-like aspartic protease/reverse transcriptase, partial [Candidatus Thiodiazotropha sp.]
MQVTPMDSNCSGYFESHQSTETTDFQNRPTTESACQNRISCAQSTDTSVALRMQSKTSIPICEKNVNTSVSIPQIIVTPSTNCLHSQGSLDSQNSAAVQCQSTSGTPVSSTSHCKNTQSTDSHKSTDRQCQSAFGTPVLKTVQNTDINQENYCQSCSQELDEKEYNNVSSSDMPNKTYSNSEYSQGDQIPRHELSLNKTFGPNTVRRDTINQPLTVNNVSSACWYFHAKIENLQIPLLFDTGSTVSIISKDTYNQMNSNRPILTPVETTLTAANGSVLELLGQGVFKLETEVKTYSWKFLVANIEGNMGIIGQDFIETQGKYLKWKNLTWRVKGGVIKLFKLHSHQVAKIVVTENVKIAPCSEAFLAAKTDYPLYEELNMLEPSPNSQKRGLLVAKSLINHEGSSQISVINITDKSIKLRPGDVLGHACPIQDLYIEDSEVSSETELPEHLRPLLENVSQELNTEEKQQFASLLSEFQDIFMSPDGQLGRTHVASHSIDVGNAKPIKIPPRKCPLAQREIIDTELDKMLSQNVIEPSDSPWSAPICLVKKSDGTYRFAIDFRGLNSVTVKDAYPLPNIRQIFDTLSGSKWYNTIDLASGYWQLQMEPNSKKYTAFTTPTRGLFQFLVMPFGLCNAGATFERAIETVLGSLRWEKCICYLDDVIIFGSDFQTTLDNLRAVFSRLRKANLKLKPSKCKFFQRQVAFLGHIATESGTRCDPEKIDAVLNWPRPESSKEIKSFLGLVNFYRSYISNCAQIAYPLNHLTKKNVRFKWDQACEDSFNELKRCLTSAPLLAYPTSSGKLILQTDASLFGIGAILSQEQDGKEVVIAYASKTLTKAQQNYCTTMRELYAVVYFVRHFKHYLMGRHFDIHTDHASLTWIKNFKDADGMLSRWLTVL